MPFATLEQVLRSQWMVSCGSASRHMPRDRARSQEALRKAAAPKQQQSESGRTGNLYCCSAVQSMGREDMVDGLFCATLTIRRRGHTPFA